MPTNKKQFIYIRKIDELLGSIKGRRVSPQKLMEACDNISNSTLKRYIKYLKNKDADIKYDRKQKGYYYAEPFKMSPNLGLSDSDLMQIKLGAEMLSQFHYLGIFDNIKGVFEKIKNALRFKTSSAVSNHIYFEHVPFIKGSEYLTFILKAIEDRKVIQFEYKRYGEDAIKGTHILHPYILKEYHNRWYVLGWYPLSNRPNKIGTFALDRIQKESLLQLEEDFYIRDSFDIENHFQHVYGMEANPDVEPEEIILEFYGSQINYFMSKPFYSNFEEEYRTDSVLRIKMYLKINFELRRKLISFGKRVKVIKPLHLAEQIKKELKAAYAQYETD